MNHNDGSLILQPESRAEIELLKGYLRACGAPSEALNDTVVMLTALSICVQNLPMNEMFEKAKQS